MPAATETLAPEILAEIRARDPLTGLLARAAFVDAVREALRSPRPFRLVAADLMRLRRLNETLGHARADLVLEALAARLAAAFPGLPVGRVGEDEFAVLLPDDGAESSGRVRAALEPSLRMAGFDIHPHFAIGAVRLEGGPDAIEPGEGLRRVALAVEAAKLSRFAAATYARELETDGLSRLSLDADLRGALERGEIEAFYQPVVRLADGKLAGFEALARWRHPKYGVLGPDVFLPLLGDAGLMCALGRTMILAAAEQLAGWREGGDEPLFVSVNLTALDIDREELPDEVEALLAAHRLPRGALKLELTEGETLRDPEKARAVMTRLSAAGASMALDDFGVGYSSLAYLSRLPVETLKIDRSFVRSLLTDEGSAKIVRSMAGLGRDLGLDIVAEGVEDAATAAELRALGCTFGQGYGYATPLPAHEADLYLQQSRMAA